MFKDWTPIEKAGAANGPLNFSQQKRVVQRLADGLLVARARRCVIVERLKIYPEAPLTTKIADPLRAAIMEMGFEWGEPMTSSAFNFDIPPEAWSPDRLGRPGLDLWLCGDETLADPRYAAPGFEGHRATFYSVEIREVEPRCEAGSQALPYSDEERRDWMINHSELNGDKAHKLFALDPRCDGTKQKEWRKEWRDVVGRGRGRPKIVR